MARGTQPYAGRTLHHTQDLGTLGRTKTHIFQYIQRTATFVRQLVERHETYTQSFKCCGIFHIGRIYIYLTFLKNKELLSLVSTTLFLLLLLQIYYDCLQVGMKRWSVSIVVGAYRTGYLPTTLGLSILNDSLTAFMYGT